ncbi:MAG: DNA polymerase III subunit delta [Gammaproteobacteria bacterium]|nr:MAG: DNA polymerase III subunit delta [Gammaproteobacteria bacterium]
MDSQQFNQQLLDGNISKFAKTYLFYGQTPFLSEENARLLVLAAKNNGFSLREIFYIENRSTFQAIFDSLHSPGLFDPKKMIELRFDTEKPTNKIGEQVAKIAAHQSDNLVIIQAGSLNYNSQKQKWFAAIRQHATAVLSKPIYANQLPNWIHQRATHLGIQLQTNALKKIMRYSEGNLLWTNQILMQLANSDYPQPVQSDVIDNMLADMSVFRIEDLLQAIFRKDNNAVKIVEKLRNENESLVYIVSILYREFDTLLNIMQSGQSIEQACKTLRIWSSKQRQYRTAIKYYDIGQCQSVLRQLAQLDKINKGLDKGDGWLLLAHIVGDLIIIGRLNAYA